MKFIAVVIILFIFSFSYSYAQDQISDKIKVYVDCSAGCDQNYIRSEITFVDFVLDRLAADVHVLITSERNGNGTNQFQLIFFGQNSFKNQVDTLIYDELANATNVETRSQITKILRFGLVPYITKIPNSRLIEITKGILTEVNKDKPINSSKNNVGNEETKDKWNYWVYKIGADAKYNVDQNYKSRTINTSMSANRTTNKLKTNFYIVNYNNNYSYKYEDSGVIKTYKFVNKSLQLEHTLVASISRNWSVVYVLTYNNSTFSNYKNRKYISAGVEYAIFPYSQVNTKFFTISYSVDVRRNNYYDTTLYNKTSETLWGHKAQANFSLKQKWGYINTGVTYSNYFNDWSLNNLSLNMSINLRVTGGLSFYVYSSGGLIHDQVYLEKGNATIQEILTRRRQLASTYSFNSGIGLSFRFGSILNNFVNPRFSNY